MAQPWAAVAASPDFQALPPDQQEAARQQYFSNVVAPNVPAAHVADVKQQFDASTAAQPAYKNNIVDNARKAYGQPSLADAKAARTPQALSNDVGGAALGPGGVGTEAGSLLSRGVQAAEDIPGVGPAIKAVGDFFTPVANQPVKNVVKSMAVNGATGGTVALASGEPVPQAAQTAGISAIVGPVMGKAVSVGLDKLGPASDRAMRLLADTFKMAPEELSKAYSNFRDLTGGRIPTLAELSNLRQQGLLKTLAARNPTVGTAAADAAYPAGAQTSDPAAYQAGLKANQGGQLPQDLPDLVAARKSAMTKRMDPLRDIPAPLTQDDLDFLMHHEIFPRISVGTAAKGEGPTIGDKLNAARDELNPPAPVAPPQQPVVPVELGGRGWGGRPAAPPTPTPAPETSSKLSVDDLDNIREQLRGMQDIYANPESGKHDRAMADKFGERAKRVEDMISAVSPEAARAIEGYRTDSRYITGYNVGFGGRTIPQAQPGVEADDLKTPEGLAGYNHGNVVKYGQDATKTIAPNTVSTQAGFDTHHAAQLGAAAATAPSFWSIAHAMRSIPGMSLPEPVQQVIAKQLFDPTMTEQAIANMQRAGMTSQQIRQAGALAGVATSAKIAQYLSHRGQ